MTERKSTEIKIRVTPSFKARVQSAADAAGVSLTEWLETSALGQIWADENHKLDGTSLLNNTIALLAKPTDLVDPEDFEWRPEAPPAKSWLDSLGGKHYRRKEPCSHSRPPYAFCAECDR